MKKRGLVLSVTAIAMAAGLMAGCTNKQAAATAQTEAAADTFNPDKEAGVSIEELREKLGDVPNEMTLLSSLTNNISGVNGY